MAGSEHEVVLHDGTESPRVVQMVGQPATITGQVDMTGLSLVRHHLQQAQLAATFLPGGESHDSLMRPIFEQIYLNEREAADALRAALAIALTELEGLDP